MSRWFDVRRRRGSLRKNRLARTRRGIFRHAQLETLENRRLLTAVPYTWQDAQIGAGGFLDGVFFDPNNSGVMYARTDIGGLYKSTNGGNNWQALLDFVGESTSSSGNGTQGGDMQVLSFALDPENSNNVYALVGDGTGSGSGSAVLYSTNAGQTWTIDSLSFAVQGNGAGRAAGERIAVDPYDSNIVLVGSNAANGLWESTNAGHSFTQVASFSTADPITFILFNPYGGTAGSPTQNIFVGQQINSSGSNIFETTNGGTAWTQIANSSGPASLYPMRAAFDSANDGSIYFTYSNQIPPEGTIGTNGGVWHYNLNTAVWTNITPAITSGTSTSEFVGLGVDAENPGTIVVTTFDHYSSGDLIFRTTNANAANPTWVSLYGGTSTRNTTQAPYMADFSDGIGNWAATAAIDPFNPAHIVYGTGQGLWTTLTGNSSSTLTAANSWYFLDNGIDFTAVIGLTAAPSGDPLFSVVGDINGFAHSTLTSSPAAGAILPGGSIGNMTYVDFAGTNPNLDAVVGTTGSEDGGFSTNDGVTWTEFASKPSGASGGTVAVTTNGAGSSIVWAPTSEAPFFSTNNGSTWTASAVAGGSSTPLSITSLTRTGTTATAVTSAAHGLVAGGSVTISGATPSGYDGTFTVVSVPNSTTFTYTVSRNLATPATGTITEVPASTPPSGGIIFADRVTPGDFYYYVSGKLWFSSNSGATFTPETSTGLPSSGAIAVNPFVTGDLWISASSGVFHSSNFGATWTKVGTLSSTNSRIALGAPAPGQTVPAIYINATINSFQGFYRSDDGGVTWVQINDTAHQWGGFVTFNNGGTFGLLAADPNVFGRVYIATNGRGVIVGNPASSLPIGWADADINSPGNPGWATSSTTLSTGATVNQWIVDGGGAGIGGISDQFNFAYQPLSGNGSVSAELLSLTNADGTNGTPQAGVMFRVGTSSSDPFAALLQTAANSLIFEVRTASGGSVTSTTLGSIPVGAEYVELIRNGNNFSALYSSDGHTWTQLGSAIAIAAMPTIANVGLVASANYNAQLTSATFSNLTVNSGPTVATVAAATPNPVTGTTTALSVLGADNGGEASLTYTWATTGTPPAAVNFSANGSNGAKNTTATFTQAGSYNFQVTITDAGGLSVTSSVTVVVNQTLTALVVSPSSANLTSGQTDSFAATALDQFGNSLTSQPAITWSLDSDSVGSIDGTGLYTAPLSPVGSATVRATSGAVSGTAVVTVGYLLGDVNIDGHRDASDLIAFLRALADLTSYQINHNLSNQDLLNILDVNRDGAIENADPQALLILLASGEGSSTPVAGPAVAPIGAPPADENSGLENNALDQPAAAMDVASPPPTVNSITATSADAAPNSAAPVDAEPNSAVSVDVPLNPPSTSATESNLPVPLAASDSDAAQVVANIPDSTPANASPISALRIDNQVTAPVLDFIAAPNDSNLPLSPDVSPSLAALAAIDRYYFNVEQDTHPSAAAALFYPSAHPLRKTHGQALADSFATLDWSDDSTWQPLRD